MFQCGSKSLQELLNLDPKVRILIVGGYSANGQARATLESGALGFIGKPYQLKELEAILRRVMDRSFPRSSVGTRSWALQRPV